MALSFLSQFINNFLSFFGDIDIYFLGISLSCLFVTGSELLCCEFFETSIILLPILLPIKSAVASAVF